jgi:hypothetical protein
MYPTIHANVAVYISIIYRIKLILEETRPSKIRLCGCDESTTSITGEFFQILLGGGGMGGGWGSPPRDVTTIPLDDGHHDRHDWVRRLRQLVKVEPPTVEQTAGVVAPGEPNTNHRHHTLGRLPPALLCKCVKGATKCTSRTS